MRVVASLTTLPKRLPYIYTTIDCILKQSYPLDKIYVNIPHKTRKGEKYVLPDNFYPNSIVQVIRCKDKGPITKIYPTLHYEKDPNTLIITFDDDVEIAPNVVEILLKKHLKYPNACLSFSGWCIGEFPFYLQFANDNEKDVSVDWLQGVHSILYPRKFLNEKTLLDYRLGKEKVPDLLRTHDDIWLSIHASNNGAQLISINKRPRFYFKSLPHNNIDSISMRGLYIDVSLEVLQLCAYLSAKGYLNKRIGRSYSMLIHFIPYFLVFFLSIFILWRYIKTKILIIPLIIIIALVLYKIAVSNVANG